MPGPHRCTPATEMNRLRVRLLARHDSRFDSLTRVAGYGSVSRCVRGRA